MKIYKVYFYIKIILYIYDICLFLKYIGVCLDSYIFVNWDLGKRDIELN